MKKLLCIIFTMLIIVAIPALTAVAEKRLFCASNSGELQMYLSPDKTSFVVATIPSCTQLNLIREEDTWGLVSANNKSGWINLSFTRETYEQAAEATGYESQKNIITKNNEEATILYTLPSSDSKSGAKEKYTVPSGTILKITRETDSGWALVPMDDDYVWINVENTEEYVVEDDIETNSIKYVYSLSENKKGTEFFKDKDSAEVLNIIPDCIRLTVIETEGGYINTSYDGVNGWVRLTDVTSSLTDAQASTGTEVGAEYIVNVEGLDSVNIYNVPSESIIDGAVIVGTVKCGKRVYALRSTYDGWLLVNVNGVVGWLQPDSALPDETENIVITPIFDSFKKGYVASEKSSGAKVYASAEGKELVTEIPECAELIVIAEKDDYVYVMCNYASGWIEKAVLKDNYNEAALAYKAEAQRFYVTKEDAALMSLPSEKEMYDSVQIATIKKGKKIAVFKVVTTGKAKWGYIKAEDRCGWINMNLLKKDTSKTNAIKIIGIVLLLCVILAVLYKILKKKSSVI